MKKQEILNRKAQSEKNYQKLINELEASGFQYHHSAYARGYVSRVNYPDVKQYDGRYGRGVKVLLPNHKSTRYAVAEYYIQTEDQEI
jgi:hypothetical protein